MAVHRLYIYGNAQTDLQSVRIEYHDFLSDDRIENASILASGLQINLNALSLFTYTVNDSIEKGRG